MNVVLLQCVRPNTGVLLIAIAMCLILWTGHTLADGGACSATASTQFEGCENEVVGNFFVEKAKCINVSDEEERKECFAEAWAARKEEKQLCLEQRDARLDVCELLGEERYDPDFDPANFDNDFANLTNPNPYLSFRQPVCK